jgi:hypothetical protein
MVNYSAHDGGLKSSFITFIYVIQFFYPFPVPDGSFIYQQSLSPKKRTGKIPCEVLPILKIKYFWRIPKSGY